VILRTNFGSNGIMEKIHQMPAPGHMPIEQTQTLAITDNQTMHKTH